MYAMEVPESSTIAVHYTVYWVIRLQEYEYQQVRNRDYASYLPACSVSHAVSRIHKEAHCRLHDKGFSLYDAALVQRYVPNCRHMLAFKSMFLAK
jgi:hypothetical protein